MAIGITPPSLNILGRVGLDRLFIREGLRIRSATVQENRAQIGRVRFNNIKSPYDYILSMPQAHTVRLLWAALDNYPCVEKLRGVEFVSVQEENGIVCVQLREPEWGINFTVTCCFLAGCDGCKSGVRQIAGISVRQKYYRQKWIMGDFVDKTTLGDEAYLFFGPHCSVESFPLPGGLRRWILLLPSHFCDPNRSDYLLKTIKQHTGHDLTGCLVSDSNSFGAQRMAAKTYYRGRVALCGDSAHVLSSIGGQGMNIGFADADMLADVLHLALREGADWPTLAAWYDKLRRESFNVAANRAACSMWLGTRRGSIASCVRKAFLRNILFSKAVSDKIAPFFAMLTIPHNRPTDKKFSWGDWLRNTTISKGRIACAFRSSKN